MRALVLVAIFVWPAVAHADPHPAGFREYEINGPSKPVTEDGVTTFHVFAEGCSTFVYGGSESDCLNGNLKSVLKQTKAYTRGESVEYKFDLWLDPNTAFPGEFEPQSVGFQPEGWDSAYRVASWEDERLRKSFAYMIKADARNGVTLLGRTCQPASKFGEWTTVSLKVRWAVDDRGWVRFTCGDKVVYEDEGLATMISQACYENNECEPPNAIEPTSMSFIIGTAVNGHGHAWKELGHDSAFYPIQPDGLTARMRNISVTTGAQLYEPEDIAAVKKLQELLNELGCNVGTPDGIAGPKTRAAARTCRAFPGGELPDKLTVGTVVGFIELYSRPDAAGLPPGDPNRPMATIVRLGETIANHTGSDRMAASNFRGAVYGSDGRFEHLWFMIIGVNDRTTGLSHDLTLIIDEPVDAKTADRARECAGAPVADWGGDGMRIGFKFARIGDAFSALDVDCIMKLLPREGQRQATYLLDNFGQVASDMASYGGVDLIRHDGLRLFMSRVAAGELTVGR